MKRNSHSDQQPAAAGRPACTNTSTLTSIVHPEPGDHRDAPPAPEVRTEPFGSLPQVLAEFTGRFQPRDAYETILVTQLANVYWRLGYYQNLEMQYIERGIFASRSLSTLSASMSLLNRTYHQLLKTLNHSNAVAGRPARNTPRRRPIATETPQPQS